MLIISARTNANVKILDLDGDLVMGGGAAKLREAISRSLADGMVDVLINFEKVKYIDSSGTGELISCLEILEEAGGSLKIINLTPKVEEVLALSSILPILDLYDDEESAMNG